MLVLNRRVEERIILEHAGATITITLCAAHRDRARIGIDAPDDVLIRREELGPWLKEGDHDGRTA
jgi:carbon storage regulator CsrA